MTKIKLLLLSTLSISICASTAFAAVSPDEAAKLKIRPGQVKRLELEA